MAKSVMHPNNLGILSIDIFNYVLFRFHIARRPKLIEDLLDYMEQQTPIQPEQNSYRFLIKTYLKLKAWENISTCLDRMQERRLEIPEDLENILLLSLGKLGKIDELEQRLQSLKSNEEKYKISEYAFHSLLEGHMNVQNYQRAIEVLGEMKSAGIEPNVRTYTLILAAYGKQGKIPEMLAIFEKMKEQQIKPNHVSYSSIINAYVKAGQLQEALNWLEKMKADNIAPNMSPYSALIYGFAKSKQYVLVERMVALSQQDGLAMSKGLKKFVNKTLKEAGASLESIVKSSSA